MDLADRMNLKQFEVSIPEVYTKIIPKYFLKETKADRPRLNGYAVSEDEFLEKFPDYIPEKGFVPDMAYAPPENNVATACSSVADIVDMINNDIVFCIFKPLQNYPKIIEILDSYLKELRPLAELKDDLAVYRNKAETASMVLHDYYLRYKNTYSIRATGKPLVEVESDYDVIARKFKKVTDE